MSSQKKSAHKKKKHPCLVQPWGKGVPFLFLEKEKLVMAYDVLIQIFCANVSQPTMITFKKKDQLQSLEMNNDFQLHLLTRGKLLCDRKKSTHNHVEKIHIDVPQKLNDFALQF